MKRPLIGLLSLIGLSGLAGPAVAHAETGGKDQPSSRASVPSLPGPTILVDPSGWGSADLSGVSRVLNAVAAAFPVNPRSATGPIIRVRHRFAGPMIAYDRDSDGAFPVYLSARNERWYEYVYQFAHEYCHLLSRFERKERNGEIGRSQQWFEESLCEAASLYALRHLAADWARLADDGGGSMNGQLRAASSQLSAYAGQLLAEPHRHLASHENAAAWLKENQDELQHGPYDREKDELAAGLLLPLFEQDPQRWRSLAYLNAMSPASNKSFFDYLAAWNAAAPAELRPVVLAIQELFGDATTRTAFRAPAP